ncbi:hypothetical protein OG205_16515 [Lentzea sp. NBC_00516]|uniref:hypothetical protein n=1 Tax=Lentzea sp. NBC_00516 TaxID=2903582 RepID=UPI002E7FE0D4|nr:hypothetical protein [Lentzea sp. NBC_00516]WUD28538.1 hypothetical protein OG205_16515 [Lentzea sp. NBC_00516]
MTAMLVMAAALGLPGMAHASTPSVQLELCNQESQSGVFEITGFNQHNNRTTSPMYNIGGRRCRVISGWWWKMDQTVSIAVRRNSLNIQDFHINSDNRDGSTVRFWVQ